MGKLQVVYRKVDEIIPYEKNPRLNDEAVEPVAESIKEFGFKIPIVLSSDGVIVAGHTRIKAAKKLGMEEVPCIIADDLTEEQVKAFRLADNKSAEIAQWDEELLQSELSEILDIDMSLFGFGGGETDFADELPDDTYTMKTNISQYEITGDCPEISEMLDTEKADDLIKEISQAEGITPEEREFLIQAARRHNVFNYRNIAEYYAHATPEMQRLMGLKYFLMLDDDYKKIDFRYADGKKLAAKPAREMDRLFEDMLKFLDASGAVTVAFAQGGDFVGGLDGGNFKKRLLRKAMNSLFCRTDRPIEFRGTMNEDVTTYTTLGSRGNLFFTFCDMCVIQIPTQSLDGGMTESYLETGTYVKTFYSVMSMPSCIKVGMMYSKHKRIHHRIDWECCVPKILNEKYRKVGG